MKDVPVVMPAVADAGENKVDEMPVRPCKRFRALYGPETVGQKTMSDSSEPDVY